MPHHDYSVEIIWQMNQDSGGQEVFIDITDETCCHDEMTLDEAFGQLVVEMSREVES